MPCPEMISESLLFAILNVGPVTTATMSATVLNENVAVRLSKHLSYAMAVKNQDTNTLYKPNMITTPKLPRDSTKNSIHPPGSALI